MSKDRIDYFIGYKLLDALTTGMYNNPLMIYREYIQNSVDAIDEAVDRKILDFNNHKIDIFIDGKLRSITIIDNGTGVKEDDITLRLCSIGNSKKDFFKERGFRGIGRLGGLGYCENLIFETKTEDSESVFKITFAKKDIMALLKSSKDISLNEGLNKIISITKRKKESHEKNRFFKVTMKDVINFHKDDLMDLNSIEKYVSKNAPLPYNLINFSFAPEINDYLNDIDGFKQYNIFINNKQMFKPYNDQIIYSEGKPTRIRGVSFCNFENNDGNIIAKGWIAETDLLGSLPKHELMRGIKVKQGNISVGGNNILEEIYTEKRFAGWHIGELHVNYFIPLNARRDDFEHVDNYEELLEQLFSLGNRLSKSCRVASQVRNEINNINSKLENLSTVYTKIKYSGEEKFRMYNSLKERILNIEKKNIMKEQIPILKAKYLELHKNMNHEINPETIVDKRKIKNKTKEEIIIDLYKKLKETNLSNGKIFDNIFSYYFKSSFNNFYD